MPASSLAAFDREDNADLDDLQFWLQHVLEPAAPPAMEELLPNDDPGDLW
ncbi:MAG: hypothetical protein WD049_07520 [Candidatus Paceibacterota bacterium]